MSADSVPETTTAPTEDNISKSTISIRSYTTNTAPKVRTRCRTVHELQPQSSQSTMNLERHKKILCDTDVIAGGSYCMHGERSGEII
ncbi:unnamed protein product [Gongylonema pulchrum]|uniref:Uncharacterized protein n=1 Tax=Gongylonema pulchrum TaxID=637853 RepID=A0A3P6RES5_9BILA|nr:unnamed protein product [Gongylonema pulchrum]